MYNHLNRRPGRQETLLGMIPRRVSILRARNGLRAGHHEFLHRPRPPFGSRGRSLETRDDLCSIKASALRAAGSLSTTDNPKLRKILIMGRHFDLSLGRSVSLVTRIQSFGLHPNRPRNRPPLPPADTEPWTRYRPLVRPPSSLSGPDGDLRLGHYGPLRIV